MLPASYSCRLFPHLNGVADLRVGPILSASLFAATIRAAAVRGVGGAGGSIPFYRRQAHLTWAALGDRQQQQQPLAEQLLWSDRGTANPLTTTSPTSPTSPKPRQSNSSAGASTSPSSTLATEALRPRRFSAPVIARLLRSTVSLQALSDVVLQQSPYLDIPLVTVALLHLALLYSRGLHLQQQQQPQQRLLANANAVASPGPIYAAGSSSNNDNSSSNNNNSSSNSSSSSGNRIRTESANAGARAASTAAGAAAATAATAAATVGQVSASFWSVDGNDDTEDLALQMSSLLDAGDEEEEEGVADINELGEGVGEAATGKLDRGDENRGDNGLLSSAAQPAVLLGYAVAAADPAAEPPGQLPSLLPLGYEDGNGVGDIGGEMLLEADVRISRVVAIDRPDQGSGGSSGSNNADGSAVASGDAAAAAVAAAPPPPLSPVGSALRVLVPLVLADLDGVSGSDLSKVVSALAVLRYDNKVVIEQLLQVLSLKLIECSPQELANVLVSLALLGVAPDPYVRSNIYSAAKYQSRRFTPRDLALTLWAYGALGTDVQEDAVLVVLEASKPKLAAFSPLYLAKAVQGLAALRYRPPPEWLAAYCEALRPALRRTASSELCAVLLALADLQVTLDDITRATLLVHTLTSLPSLGTPELARSIWALGRITAAGLPTLIDLDTSARVLEVTLTRLRQGAFSGGDLQRLLEGLTRLALQPPLEWMQAYVAVLQPKLATLEARQLAGVLGSLAAQQYRLEPEMQRVVMAATQQNMRQLLADTTATALLITALRRLNIEPPSAWVAALLDASRSALKNRATDLHLANMAGALAAWGVRPDGRWTARLMWRSQVLMQQGRMSPRALVALLQAMSALGLRPNPVWTDLCLHSAVSRASHSDFEPQHFSTLLPALHALEIKPPQEWLSRLMLTMYRCWERFTVTHWSSMLPALVLLEAEPPHEWLQRLEDVVGPRLADCSALQLLTLLVSLIQLRRLGLEGMRTASAAAAAVGEATTTSTAVPAAAAAAAPGSGGDAQGPVARAAESLQPPPRREACKVATGSARKPSAVTAADVREAAVAAEAAFVPLQQHSAGNDAKGDENSSSGRQPDAIATAAAEPPAVRPDLAAGHGPLACATTSISASNTSNSSSSMVLTLTRLRNLRTARWRQRRLARLAEAEAMPRGAWLAAWWAASGLLLARVRYAPSELLLTASWLVSLKMRPPSEWLEACIEVSQRYSKVMGPAEQMQLAAVVLPLAGRRANLVATKHQRRVQQQPPLGLSPSSTLSPAGEVAEAATPGAAAAGPEGMPASVAAGGLGAKAGRRSGRRRRQGKGGNGGG